MHEAVEFWENSDRTVSLNDVLTVCSEAYDKHTNRLAAETPNFDFWFRSGGYRRSVEEDITRRYGISLQQTERYLEYYSVTKPKEILFRNRDDRPFVEQPFEFELDGVPIRGYIDQVVWDPEKKAWCVRDVKTGKSPGDEVQLAVYALAMLLDYGIEITHGDYWMARTAKPTIRYSLKEWGKDRITAEFKKLDEDIRAERFEPNPSPSNCQMCSVSAACDFAEF